MVLAGLPTYRSSQPMEGRLKWPTRKSSEASASEVVSMRLGIFPTVHGARAVIRLLRNDYSFESLETLGLHSKTTAQLQRLTEQTDGAILMSGPAGSGKTTTLYAMLRQISQALPRRSVITIEDPVEAVINSISQSDLDSSGGMTLASALRSAVRQDSEVLLVSEVRDPETAEAVIQSSLTGHLVFSSLHATDVAASLRRLIQFGVPIYALRSGIRAILAQRLLRKVCKHCEAGDVDPPICEDCLGTGYCGRIAIGHCVCFDGSDSVGEAMAELLESGASISKLRNTIREAGGEDLRTQAMQLVSQGVTDTREVYRVLGDE